MEKTSDNRVSRFIFAIIVALGVISFVMGVMLLFNIPWGSLSFFSRIIKATYVIGLLAVCFIVLAEGTALLKVVFNILFRRGNNSIKEIIKQHFIFLPAYFDMKLFLIALSFLFILPIGKYIIIAESIIPEGKYPIEVEYSLFGEIEYYDEDIEDYWYKEISEEGSVMVDVSILNTVYYEDRESFATGYEYTSTDVSLDTDIYIYGEIPVAFENGKKYSFEIPDYNSSLDAQCTTEIYSDDGHQYNLSLNIGNITEERLGYGIDEKLANSDISELVFGLSVDFVLIVLNLIGLKRDMACSKAKSYNNDKMLSKE